MQKIISLLTFLFCLQAYTQKDTLLYKDYLDYYSVNAKSTVLNKDLQFLKNGKYIFKGSVKDFDYLLNNILEEKMLLNLSEVDTLYLSGKIKNSVKIKQWCFYKKNDSSKSILKELFINRLNYKNGKIQDKLTQFNGKYYFIENKDFIGFNFRNINTSEKGYLRFYKKNDTIKYLRNKDFYCAKYEITIYQTSENLNNYLKTEIAIWNLEKIKRGVRLTDKTLSNEYRLIIKEKFKEKKLIKISIKYKYNDKGKEYFKKYINTTNFLNFITGNLECIDINLSKK